MMGKSRGKQIINFIGSVFNHMNVLLLIVGVLLIAFSARIQDVLHWVVGPVTIATGGLLVILGVRDYKNDRSIFRLSAAAILSILGIIIMTQRENAVGTIMIIWGFLGLSNGCYRLFGFVRSTRKRMLTFAEMIVSLADAALGIMLLINPYRDVRLHIILLGVELILMSIRPLDEKLAVRAENRAVSGAKNESENEFVENSIEAENKQDGEQM